MRRRLVGALPAFLLPLLLSMPGASADFAEAVVGDAAYASHVADAAYADALIARARELEVARSRAWLRLGHWHARPASRSRFESEADGAAFFLAPEGARDPQAELEATIRGFFAPGGDETGEEDGSAPPEHAICRFPARFLHLSRVLEIEPGRLRVPRCQRFLDFMEDLGPSGVTLVFSSYFMNNPASALGHTFLRVDRAAGVTTRRGQELLDTGIDFGANVDTDNAFLYGVKGLVGLFPGTFRRLAYY